MQNDINRSFNGSSESLNSYTNYKVTASVGVSGRTCSRWLQIYMKTWSWVLSSLIYKTILSFYQCMRKQAFALFIKREEKKSPSMERNRERSILLIFVNAVIVVQEIPQYFQSNIRIVNINLSIVVQFVGQFLVVHFRWSGWQNELCNWLFDHLFILSFFHRNVDMIFFLLVPFLLGSPSNKR